MTPFNASLFLESGNHIIDVVAENEQGEFGFASLVVQVDGEGPMVGIQTPRDREVG
jgi:hypothetical protein